MFVLYSTKWHISAAFQMQFGDCRMWLSLNKLSSILTTFFFRQANYRNIPDSYHSVCVVCHQNMIMGFSVVLFLAVVSNCVSRIGEFLVSWHPLRRLFRKKSDWNMFPAGNWVWEYCTLYQADLLMRKKLEESHIITHFSPFLKALDDL